MNVLSLVISLISGAIGGNIAGSSLSQKNLGPIVNTIAGLIGGGAGDFLLKAFGVITAATAVGNGAATGNELDISQILASIGAGGVSGGVLTAIITFLKGAVKK
ncbi:putative membrane protein [Waddlia chondrophila 2032/99]|uniref:Putative membrane protein n=2 Tax=Waddlia chondrophila TaxID=71667 RepID=D6YS38_WADCW|nr:hypothetical protein [Waddlia chondrophila]ADI38883.1 putative membrane protein [Waddlia chondrophila WSU 86-1044]CCB90713.1 putative membrane protein [Waddlia chondrophila 2032/99]